MGVRVIKETERRTPVIIEADVVVAGGGAAGIAAAIGVARNGYKVVLCERYGYLTGLHASAFVGCFCGFYIAIRGNLFQLIHGIGGEILDRLNKMGGLNPPVRLHRVGIQTYDHFMFKMLVEKMLLESGVKILMHSLIVDVVMDNNKMRGVIIENKETKVMKIVRDAIPKTSC